LQRIFTTIQYVFSMCYCWLVRLILSPNTVDCRSVIVLARLMLLPIAIDCASVIVLARLILSPSSVDWYWPDKVLIRLMLSPQTVDCCSVVMLVVVRVMLLPMAVE